MSENEYAEQPPSGVLGRSVVPASGRLLCLLESPEMRISRCRPAAPARKTAPKLAGRMKRRWRVALLRAKGEILGTVEAPDVAAAKAVAAVQFELDEIHRNRIMVQELG